MSTNSASSLNPMAVVRSMSEGIIALAMVSAMVRTFGSMIPYVAGAAGFSKSTTSKSVGAGGFSDPREELESLNKRISSLSFRLENQMEAVRGTRKHKVELMKEYGLGVLPSVVEMKKYPKLKMTDYYLRKAEQDLDRMELSMMNLQKRRKELQVKLGMRPDESEGVRRVYPATKKFTEPIRRGF